VTDLLNDQPKDQTSVQLMDQLNDQRQRIAAAQLQDEAVVLAELQSAASIDISLRQAANQTAIELVKQIRADDNPGIMEVFLAEYGLSTDEGVALMCLAEALLRVPDTETMDALIEDKIVPSNWGEHLGQSSSSLVNASTWALMLTGNVLNDSDTGIGSVLRDAVKRLGEPVIRAAVRRAMKEMGNEFVLGETIDEALERGADKVEAGYTYSYDMLGEAALTDADADAFFHAYSDAIASLEPHCQHDDIRLNPGISVKLSALHPRYETTQHERVLKELVPRLSVLAKAAKDARMGFNIDAEEADRLELSLDVIAHVLADKDLENWDGFAVVVQAYSKRALPVIDWLYALASQLDRKIMVRLVKGAYWDSEIKRAQVEGLTGFPVFTRKAATDVSYVCCAKKLITMTDRIYPQFATHNAHTVATVLELTSDPSSFEFQRLHGMGDALHDLVLQNHGTRCRIYAPVGAHQDLLAYLVRRLLENGANSSFVNQLVDTNTPVEVVAADPFDAEGLGTPNPAAVKPANLFKPERINSQGLDLHDSDVIEKFNANRDEFLKQQWQADPLVAATITGGLRSVVFNPADESDIVGHVTEMFETDVNTVMQTATPWSVSVDKRSTILNRVADLYEHHQSELFALLCREAGKTPNDVVAELREAVDFLRYYAARCKTLSGTALGRVVCISPWNFPLAIFTGQISAALAAGNAVIAKPAESTPLVAARAVSLMHQAGVPIAALQLIPGTGSIIGSALVSHPQTNGVAFTGSTATAKLINRAMSVAAIPGAPLIAETGGLNAMIVDSTALPEQAVRDIVESAFQSAGQRCSALRVLYLQEDIANSLLKMLKGAMDELTLGDPWQVSTDIGPVISQEALTDMQAYVDAAKAEARIIHQVHAPSNGNFIAPVAIEVSGIEALEKEVFGPVLHIARFEAEDIQTVISAINAEGYGLTFGLHTRIDGRVQEIVDGINAGNVYINRNQIGAVVGSQPFGGEGLSGTGPKAGGPHYLTRYTSLEKVTANDKWDNACDLPSLQNQIHKADKFEEINKIKLPGPTGESNKLSLHARGPVLCMGPGEKAMQQQISTVQALGGIAIGTMGSIPASTLTTLEGITAVIYWADDAQDYAIALANRQGPILSLITGNPDICHVAHERHLCIDTTAAGGNASLLASD